MKRTRLGILLVFLSCTFFSLIQIPQIIYAAAPVTERASISTDNLQANGASYSPSISPDGRLLAFSSNASNLVANDRNNQQDVFVRDRQTSQTVRVSTASSGAEANGFSQQPAISADGRYVAFVSSATNLSPNDTNFNNDIYVHDTQTGNTIFISDGHSTINSQSGSPAISADGRFVAFQSDRTMVPNVQGGIFVRDIQSGITDAVSIASDGTPADGYSESPAITPDGRYVAFTSNSTTLTTADTHHLAQIYRRDRENGQTILVSVGLNGDGVDLSDAVLSDISADGRYVTFSTKSSNMVPNDNNGMYDVFMRDILAGTTVRVSQPASGADPDGPSVASAITSNGRYIAFYSIASNLVQDDTSGLVDGFVRDMNSGQIVRISVTSNGGQGDNHAGTAAEPIAISDDGQIIAFVSLASNMVNNDTNGIQDIFVRNLGGTSTSTYSISGKITDKAGSPIRDVKVFIGLSPRATTGADGVYMIDNLSPGKYILTPFLQNYTFSPQAPTVTVSKKNVTKKDFTGTFVPPPPPVVIRKVVVFLGGVCTSIGSDGTTNSDTFNDLQKMLRDEYGYTDNDFLLYSYKGGSVDKKTGTWHPKAYKDTDPLAQDFRTKSLDALHDKLLIPYHKANPKTTFILVGHSLGGMVAFEEIVKHVVDSGSNYEPGLISTVITVDSPLHGTHPDLYSTGQIGNFFDKVDDCASKGNSAKIITGLYNNEPKTTQTLKSTVSGAVAKGVAVVNVGNWSDCLWGPFTCKVPIAGNVTTQWIFESEAKTEAFDIPKPCLDHTGDCIGGTHSAVLNAAYGLDALRKITRYIGPQN